MAHVLVNGSEVPVTQGALDEFGIECGKEVSIRIAQVMHRFMMLWVAAGIEIEKAKRQTA